MVTTTATNTAAEDPTFLSKRANGYWYLWYTDESGRRVKRSTKCKNKTDALGYLTRFKMEFDEERKHPKKNVSFSTFVEAFMSFFAGVHRPSTQKHFQTASREFVRLLGNRKPREIDSRYLEHILTQKQDEASKWTVGKNFFALASMFEKAKE
ncbi:MAG: hypothetical protein QHI48_10525 [Bacteroidota bacterium]|nr:hypothetical protein [Bacteroidota bacterium]